MKLSDLITYQKPLNKGGMFAHWTASMGDVTSVQPSQEQATNELVKAVKDALTGSYEPVILFHQGYYACCWREWDGWRYAIRLIGKSITTGGWTAGFVSKDECVGYAQKHLESYGE